MNNTKIFRISVLLVLAFSAFQVQAKENTQKNGGVASKSDDELQKKIDDLQKSLRELSDTLTTRVKRDANAASEKGKSELKLELDRLSKDVKLMSERINTESKQARETLSVTIGKAFSEAGAALSDFGKKIQSTPAPGEK